MKKIILIIIVAVGLYGNYYYKHNYKQNSQEMFTSTEDIEEHAQESVTAASNTQFKCDGRTRCSQMTSCEEATFFINNCPNTEMDGDNDGIPCEKQWCK